jgi:peptide deformylase
VLLKLYQAGQPILRKSAKLVTKSQLTSQKTQTIIDFMIATLRDAPGVGIAAPQIGESLQIIVVEDKAAYHETVPADVLKEQGRKPVGLKVLINPKLESVDNKLSFYFEGCLSVEGFAAVVPRMTAVKVTAWDRTGKDVSYLARGWQARILQHEVDHLQGKLYVDSMIPQSFMAIKNFAKLWRKALQADIRKAFLKD